jgi:HK97 family phage major capsid protein
MTLSTESWLGRPFPPQVSADLGLAVVGAAPFAGSLPVMPLAGGSMAFPLVSPDGADWTAELAQLPDIDPHDHLYEIASAKLAGIVLVSNEAVRDAASGIYTGLQAVLANAFAPQLDKGLLYGGTAPAPKGLFQHADLTTVTAASWREAAITAAAELAGQGAGPLKLYASPTDLGEVYAQLDAEGRPLYLGWGSPIGGLEVVPVAELQPGDALVAAPARLWRVESSAGFEVSSSREFAFDRDATALRVVGRFAIAAPALARAARRLAITAP